ncbi:MAG: hypothetical protein ACI9EW_001970, partial [Cellvibrionaceae bacterium]
MKMSNRSLIITFLIILAILLMALIGLLLYNLWQLRQPATSSATIYLVDSSIRMAEPLGEGTISRLEAAQEFVNQAAVRLPNTEIVSVHVFGSGTNENGCEDTFSLVRPNQENQSEIIEKIALINPISSDAAMVRAAIEALEELADSGYVGTIQLVIITGGNGTCSDDLDQIVRTANFYGFELAIDIVNVVSSRGEPVVISMPSIISAREIVIDSEESIAEGVELVGSFGTVVLSPIAVSSKLTAAASGTLGSAAETETAAITPSQTPIPTISAIPTITPSPTVTSTGEALSSPATTPLSTTGTPETTGTTTITPSPIPTSTQQPSATPGLVKTPTATLIPPTNTFTPVPPTSVPATSVPPTSIPPTSVPPTTVPDSRISILDVIVNESAGNAVVTLQRADVNNKAVTVDFNTSDGSALAGFDYVATSGQVAWAANNGTDKTITVQIINDLFLEASESFNILLSNPVNASISDGSGTVNIQDNESGSILINPTSISVSESAGSTSATITLNGEPQGSVVVNLSSTDTDLCIPVGSTVTLNATNWNSGVPIGITIVNNTDTNTAGFENCTILTSVSSSTDDNFNNVNPSDISIQVIDDDAIYVDQTCPDTDGNTICNDGIRFRTIQSAIDNGNLPLNIIVTTGPHTEFGINVTRNISLSALPGIVLRAAPNVGSATDRIMTVSTGITA